MMQNVHMKSSDYNISCKMIVIGNNRFWLIASTLFKSNTANKVSQKCTFFLTVVKSKHDLLEQTYPYTSAADFNFI